jgi:hypothetical protein
VDLLDEDGEPIGYRTLGATRSEAEDRALSIVIRQQESTALGRSPTFLERLVAEHHGTLRPLDD